MELIKGFTSSTIFKEGGLLGTIVYIFVILAVTGFASYVLVRVMYKGLKKATGGDIGGSIIANMIRVFVWVCGISLILEECFKLNTSALIGALGVGGIALSLGMQNTISNLIGGLQTSFSRDIKLGDWVTIGSVTGEVKDITWRVMKIGDSDGNEHIIPNSVLNTTTVSVLKPYQPVKIPLSFSHDADIKAIMENVPKIAKEALDKAGYLHEGKEPLLAIGGTGVDCINAVLTVYVKYTCTNSQVQDSMMPQVIEYLTNAGALAKTNE